MDGFFVRLSLDENEDSSGQNCRGSGHTDQIAYLEGQCGPNAPTKETLALHSICHDDGHTGLHPGKAALPDVLLVLSVAQVIDNRV